MRQRQDISIASEKNNILAGTKRHGALPFRTMIRIFIQQHMRECPKLFQRLARLFRFQSDFQRVPFFLQNLSSESCQAGGPVMHELQVRKNSSGGKPPPQLPDDIQKIIPIPILRRQPAASLLKTGAIAENAAGRKDQRQSKQLSARSPKLFDSLQKEILLARELRVKKFGEIQKMLLKGSRRQGAAHFKRSALKSATQPESRLMRQNPLRKNRAVNLISGPETVGQNPLVPIITDKSSTPRDSIKHPVRNQRNKRHLHNDK